ARNALSLAGASDRLSATNRFEPASYTHPFATPPTTPLAMRSAFGVSACPTSVAMVDTTVPSFLFAAVTVTWPPMAATDSVGKANMNANRSSSCWVVLVNTFEARNSVRLTAPSWMKPKPRFCVGSPMLLALPLSNPGRMTLKPTFSYMLRRCGILKSCVSPSRLPLKRFPDAPVGSVWQRLHEKTPPSRFRLTKMLAPLTGLPLGGGPPPDWAGPGREAGGASYAAVDSPRQSCPEGQPAFPLQTAPDPLHVPCIPMRATKP